MKPLASLAVAALVAIPTAAHAQLSHASPESVTFIYADALGPPCPRCGATTIRVYDTTVYEASRWPQTMTLEMRIPPWPPARDHQFRRHWCACGYQSETFDSASPEDYWRAVNWRNEP